MRITSLLTKLLGLKGTRVHAVDFEADGIALDVRPTTSVPRCSGCGRKAHATYDRYEGRRWRHLDLAGMKTQLCCDLRRVSCTRCGVRVEQVPWAAPGSWFTHAFENQAAYLAQRTDQTTVCRLMRIAWRTVGQIAGRVVERRDDDDDLLDGLTHIGIDELSYRKHHEYVTVVVDHLRGRVVWAHKGKNAETAGRFFEDLGVERCAKLKAVTIDMSKAYIKAVTEAVPHAQLVFDRFHVQRLLHDAVDAVRRAEVRDAEPDAQRGLKRTRWPLLKNPWNLSEVETQKLAELPRSNKRLFRSYLLKEALLAVLDRRQVHVARRKLDEWIHWARRSRLTPFVKLARTIRAHIDGILAYVQSGLSNGRVEGLNGKIRTITRRAFGFHSASSLIGLIFLCCSGLTLAPSFRTPSTTH